MADHFITEFGHRIDFVPGYFEKNRYYADRNLIRLFEHQTTGEKTKQTVTNQGPYTLKRWVSFSAIISFLARNGLLGRWKTAIDLGGAEGEYMRMFKAAGFIENATTVDIVGYDIETNDAYFSKFLKFVAKRGALEKHDLDALEFYLTVYRQGNDFCTDGHYLDGLHVDFRATGNLDRSITGSLFDIEGSFDFISAFGVLDLIDLEQAFAKVRGLINPGGLFVSSTNYFWWPVNAGGIVANFPYAAQRLTFSDIRRYFTEHHRDQLENLNERYYYFHQRRERKPTLDEYLSAASKCGLKLLAFERVMPTKSHRMQTPNDLMNEPWFDIASVLRDIHQTRPDVVREDLLTAALRLAFTPE